MNAVTKLEGQQIAKPKFETPQAVIESAMAKSKGEFLKVLPTHISFEKFQRTVMTAITQNPELAVADRPSLMLSCIKSATDGLLPDGRDAALVIFKAKVQDESGKDVWIKKVQYMPMYSGILKKIRQSKELASVVSHVVYERDKFDYSLGDNEGITHIPYMGAEDRGRIVAAYCIAKLKDGTVVREVMPFQDIEKVRRSSKAGNDDAGKPKGIWASWYEEMARKTVFRRTAKWLPQSIDLIENVFENDDSMEMIGNIQADAPMLENPKAPQQAITQDGEVIDQIPDAEADKPEPEKATQPDLKDKIEKKKAEESTSKPAEKEEPKPQTEEDAQVIEQRVAYAFAAAKNPGDLDALWNVDFAEDILKVKNADFDGFKRLNKAFQDRLSVLEAK